MIQYNPSGIFEQNPSKGGICTLLDKAELNTALGTYTWISAVAGKRIVVVSASYSANGAVAGACRFTSNAIDKHTDNLAPNTILSKTLEFNPAGWFESETGFSLTFTGSVAFNLSTRYFYYTP